MQIRDGKDLDPGWKKVGSNTDEHEGKIVEGEITLADSYSTDTYWYGSKYVT
jgi:hypothetical protein